jgi:predicted enzyme related to lactoylglutathione lyase
MANTFAHCELATTDLEKAKSFYGSLFDWQLQDYPMPDSSDTYTFIKTEGGGGGMLKQPMPNAPSSWIPYISVDNIDDATKKATSLGATLYKDVVEIPGMGAFSVLGDPTGAAFGLWESRQT